MKMKNSNHQNGFILIDKTSGMTTYDIIRKLKKRYSKQKFGHTGTLDKNTTGLVVIAKGTATKFIPLLTKNSKKKYIATMQIGIQTDTVDLSGEIINRDKTFNFSPDNISKIKKKFEQFQKTYDQKPPEYSAKKINGKRASDIKRQGKEVKLKTSQITIYSLNILEINNETKEIKFAALVSKGTYIRSLIQDIACELGTIAVMSQLKRIETDGFNIEQAATIENYETNGNFIQLNNFLEENYENIIEVENKLAQLLKNGLKIKNPEIIQKFDYQKQFPSNQVLMKDLKTQKLIAIYERNTTSEFSKNKSQDVVENQLIEYRQLINLWSEND